MVSDTPNPPPSIDEFFDPAALTLQPGVGPATRALIEARNRRLAAQADVPPPPESSNAKRERHKPNPWLNT